MMNGELTLARVEPDGHDDEIFERRTVTASGAAQMSMPLKLGPSAKTINHSEATSVGDGRLTCKPQNAKKQA